jgi:SAM-dependent methyltransferase
MPHDFELVGIVPWGRAFAEYRAFFSLGDVPPAARVLDCGGGPASFAAEWAALGGVAVAADPLYLRSPGWIEAEFEAVVPRMIEGMVRARDRFNWDVHRDPEHVVRRRRAALHAFLEDYGSSSRRASYVAARLPRLPFPEDSFDLVLCSHLLFLYSEELDLDAHVDALREMLRVGREVRVFPLLDMDGGRSRHVERALKALQAIAEPEVVPVAFEFQRGGTEMLRVRRTL